jgi:regulator of sigma E protease
MLLTIVAFIVILSVLVLVHEFGHFITAKRLGIKVEEFGFGFPPRAFGVKFGETLYSINWLPIGGFVKLYGEDEAGGGSLKKTEDIKRDPGGNSDLKRAFFTRPPWQKALIVFAGVVMNFILAVVILSYLFSVPGVTVPKGYAQVVKTLPGTPAARINLEKGDRIVSFNGNKVNTITDLQKMLAVNKEKPGTLVITRNGKSKSFEVAPKKTIEDGQTAYLIGVELTDTENKKYSWYEAPIFGTIEAAKFSWLILTGIVGIFTDLISKGKAPTDVAGPVGVAQIVGQAAAISFDAVLWVSALLSLNLAVVNVLPIPALDGGRLFFILIELFFRKKVSPKYETLAHSVGLAVLLMLILLITLYDIGRIITGQSLIPKM